MDKWVEVDLDDDEDDLTLEGLEIDLDDDEEEVKLKKSSLKTKDIAEELETEEEEEETEEYELSGEDQEEGEESQDEETEEDSEDDQEDLNKEAILQAEREQKALKAQIEELETKLSESEKAKKSLGSSSRKAAKEAKEANKVLIENRIKDLEDRAAIHYEAGEIKEAVKLGKDISALQIDQRIIEAELKDYEEAEEHVEDEPSDKQEKQREAKTEPNADDTKIPKVAQDWMDDNLWYGRKSVLTAIANDIGDTLLSEGYNMNKESFYVELEDRIKDYAIEHNLKIPGKKLPRKAPKRQKAGPSAPGNRRYTTKKGTGISLTDEQREVAKNMGVDPKEYAKALIQEKRAQKSGSGYVPVFDE